MKRIQLHLSGGRGYCVWIGERMFSSRARIWTQDPVLKTPGRAFLIADSKLRDFTGQVDRALRARGWKTSVLRVHATERSKNLKSLAPIYARMIREGADRDSVIFAVGGGVIGDLSGFIAATYMRGLRWVGVPTTLLAQVDSSVGGKTGVNHALGKNLIGAFHQPSAVICDISFLRTLPKREIVSGLGEVLKYALLSDERFLRRIEDDWDALLRLDHRVLEKAVFQSLSIKARIVEKDEYETGSLRAKLNLGHTIGHALESATGYSRYRHGEAVIHGLRAALEISAERGHLASEKKSRLLRFLKRASVPSIPRSVSAARISALALHDKKARNGQRRFVLLKDVGKLAFDDRVSEEALLRALRAAGFGARA